MMEIFPIPQIKDKPNMQRHLDVLVTTPRNSIAVQQHCFAYACAMFICIATTKNDP